MTKNLLTALLITLLLSSCALSRKKEQTYQEFATLWMNTSAELTALSYQAYNIARLRLDQKLKTQTKKPKAIIVDVDETVLDNSPYQVTNILDHRSYTEDNWKEWLDLAKAPSVKGASEFLNYAKSKGVTTFYITNRKMNSFEVTYKNLVDQKFPITKSQLIPRTESGNSKENRRIEVLKKYDVIMYFGDSLGDFHKDFEKVEFKNRKEVVEKYKKNFGDNFIILPNPMYGEWIDSIYNYNHTLSEKEKKKLRFEVFKSINN